MKNLLFFITIILFLSSCNKEEPYNPDEHITYEHWYKLSGSADTLYSVYFPNAFTPVADGINDVFKPVGENYNLNHFRVYNKTGEIIFETTDRAKSWNGRVNGSGYIVQMGAYSYQLMVSDIYGVNYEYTGTVMLYK
jgi:gliding motility-associated-like protein